MNSRRLLERQEYEGLLREICWDMSGSEERAIRFCAFNSRRLYKGNIDGELVCAFGLVPPTILSSRAYLWFWHSLRLREHPFALVRQSQIVVKEMLKEYEVIVGHCKADDPKAIRWLKWLGAKFGKLDGRAMPFEIRRG